MPHCNAAVFQGVHHLVMKNSSVYVNQGAFENCPALHDLANAIKYKAMHNAAREGEIQQCHPKTRRAILQKISDWIDEPSPDSRILWLRGPAGVGKTTIARTVCDTLDKQGRLAGDFFFCRVRGISRVDLLFATIAYQLAIAVPYVRRKIQEALVDDPAVIFKAIDVQLQELIVEPLLFLLENHPETLPLVICIDGLDECRNLQDQCKIIQILGSVSRHQPPLPVRFIICSRPEPWIRAEFDSVATSGARVREITLGNNLQARRDIRTYFEDEFGKIVNGPQHKSKMSYVQMPWPSQKELDTLVEKSSGQFIYASTVIKFVSDLHYRPNDRLRSVLTIPTVATQTSNPFEDLDRLYVQILSEVPPDLKQPTLDVLGALAVRTDDVTCISRSFTAESLDIVEVLLGLLPGEGYGFLQALHSVVQVPESIGGIRETMAAEEYCKRSSSGPTVKFHNRSFIDFLFTEARSRRICVQPHTHDQTCDYDYFVGRKDMHRRLALGCLKLLKGLSSDFAPRLHYVAWYYAIEDWCDHCVESGTLDPQLAKALNLMDIFSCYVFPVFQTKGEKMSQKLTNIKKELDRPVRGIRAYFYKKCFKDSSPSPQVLSQALDFITSACVVTFVYESRLRALHKVRKWLEKQQYTPPELLRELKIITDGLGSLDPSTGLLCP